MAIGNVQVGAPVTLTSSGVVAGGSAMTRTYPGGASAQGTQAENTTIEGTILGFFVNSGASTPTLQLSTNNGGAAGTPLTGTMTFAATPSPTWYPLPITSPGGIFATIANTLSVTFVVVK